MNSSDGFTVPEESAWSPGSEVKSADSGQLGTKSLPTPATSRVQSYEHMMGTGKVSLGMMTPPRGVDYMDGAPQTPVEAEREKRELFDKLTTPRVRYDVEVVTKLIVYSGKYYSEYISNVSQANCLNRHCMVSLRG